MGLKQTYKLLHSKGNHKLNKKTTHRMGEKIFANYMTDKSHMIWLQMKLLTRFKCYDISHNIQTDCTT